MYPGQNRLAILFLFTVLVRHLSMSVLEKSLVRIFRVCCLLFSYQCSFLLLPFHSTAFIFYQKLLSLSRTFFILFFEAFQKIKLGNLWIFPAFASYKKTFAFKLHSLTDLCDSDIYLTTSFRHCQELFSIFCISSHDRPINWILVESTTTEKEGFEPSRRVNDLHP